MIPGALCVMIAGLMWMPVLLADNWATPDSVSEPFTWFMSHNYHYNSFVCEAKYLVFSPDNFERKTV